MDFRQEIELCFYIRGKKILLEYTKKKANRSKSMLQFNWLPAIFIKQRKGGCISDDTK